MRETCLLLCALLSMCRLQNQGVVGRAAVQDAVGAAGSRAATTQRVPHPHSLVRRASRRRLLGSERRPPTAASRLLRSLLCCSADTPHGPLLLPCPPFADARLQPRDTRLTAAFLLLFACVVAGAVFVAVPRGVSVGEITVKTDRMSWNTTKARPAPLFFFVLAGGRKSLP